MTKLEKIKKIASGKLKILQVIHFPLEGAGAGHYVHNLSTGLVKEGHKVGVVYAQSPKCTRKTSTYEMFPVDFENDCLNFPFPVFESHPLGSDLTFGSIGENKYNRYVESFEKELDRAIEEINPDIINVHHGWILSEIVSRKGIPYFITLHGTEAKAFDKYSEYRDRVLKGIKGASGIIALTEDQKENAISKYGVNPENCNIITSGVDTDFFYPRNIRKEEILLQNGVQTKEGELIALYVGRLAEVKGVEYLVDSAIKLKMQNKNVKILIVGDGILKDKLMEIKRKHDLYNLEFLGLKGSIQILDLYNAADLVVVPSQSECFPLVPAEAMACGTPFVASNIPGGLNYQITKLEDLLKEEQSVNEISLSFQVGDPESLASKIGEVLDMDLKKNFKESIRELSISFSLSDMVMSTGNLYSGAI
ncbi:MAG: glycosyltransferase family 4 protein [Nanoarchaeota archaeon]|jgi:glycosyltransferase involved in cell wall biosynthesis|nr:glycosyltransferase family 4 protein [Nanoarchaeota archaeon]